MMDSTRLLDLEIRPFSGACAAADSSDADDDHAAGGSHPLPKSSNKGNSNSNSSQWHRMKWTDDIIRLLIATVSDADFDGTSQSTIQKKGKWKTISKLMLDRGGCYVSPQQCEDKFNDLNKRYKRLNDLLGRGTTCQVVENPALLDSMDIPAKSKEDARKILSSKHLFYREMCAYHNGPRTSPGCSGGTMKACSNALRHSDEEEDDEDDDNDDDSSGDHVIEKLGFDRCCAELDTVLQDRTKSVSEKRKWFKLREVQLQEERVEIQSEAFEIVKRQLKWNRFRSKKDRELEVMWMEKQRLVMENEQLMLQVRQNEVELNHRYSGNVSECSVLRFEIDPGRNCADFGSVH